MDDLERARQVREERAQELKGLQEGTTSLRDVLLRTPGCLSGAHVYILLYSTKGMGSQTTKHVLMDANVWPLTPVSQLSRSARLRIIEHLPERIK